MTGYTKKQLEYAINYAVRAIDDSEFDNYFVRTSWEGKHCLISSAAVKAALLAMGVTEFEPIKAVKYVNLYRNGPNMIHASNPFKSRSETDKEAERYEQTTRKKRIAVKKIVEGEFDV